MKYLRLLLVALIIGCASARVTYHCSFMSTLKSYKKLSGRSYELYFQDRSGRLDTVHQTYIGNYRFMVGDKFLLHVDTVHRYVKLQRLQ